MRKVRKAAVPSPCVNCSTIAAVYMSAAGAPATAAA
jgi:hypothetical protein